MLALLAFIAITVPPVQKFIQKLGRLYIGIEYTDDYDDWFNEQNT